MTENNQYEEIVSLFKAIGMGASAKENFEQRVIYSIKENGMLYCDVETYKAIPKLQRLVYSLLDQSTLVGEEDEWIQRQVIETAYAVGLAAVKNEPFDNIISEFLAEIKTWDSSWLVAVPILGLSLFHKTMEIGGYKLQIVGKKNLVFAKASQEEFHSFDREFRKRCYLDDELQTQYLALKELDVHNGKVHLLLTISGNPSAAKEKGIEIAQRFVDIIRFSSEAMFAINENIKVGLMGEFNFPDRQTLVVSDKLSLVESDSMSPLATFNLDAAFIHKLKSRKVEELLNILSKNTKSELEKDILLSLRWYSLGYRHRQAGISFLNIITALECFVDKSSNSSPLVTKMISNIVCSDRADRRIINREMTCLYEIRQSIAHDGFEHTKLEDLERLESYYARFISSLVGHLSVWKSRNDIIGYLNSNKSGT